MQLARTLNAAIRELEDPRIPLIVTVEHVNISSDHESAQVFVSALNADMSALLEALNRAKGYLRREVARQGNFRHTPSLTFCAATEGAATENERNAP